MTSSILLATDLDRTVLPNGAQEESPAARPRFRTLVARDDVTLVTVSGRGKVLQQEAFRTFDIPVPAYAIGDVGTTIYITHDGSWEPLAAWQDAIASDWSGHDWSAMRSLFKGIAALRLQEESKQNTFKVSYYAPEDTDRDALLATMQQRLDGTNVRASLIWSIDEQAHMGLLDVLPLSATKLHALQFLREHLGFPVERTVFCGDSGNDMPALTSGLNAVLVANAREQTKEEATETLRKTGMADRLYIARGDFLGMNGNYCAGVLEGVAHFFPETKQWMEE